MSRSLILAGVFPAYSAVAIFFFKAFHFSSTFACSQTLVVRHTLGTTPIRACINNKCTGDGAAVQPSHQQQIFLYCLQHNWRCCSHAVGYKSTCATSGKGTVQPIKEQIPRRSAPKPRQGRSHQDAQAFFSQVLRGGATYLFFLQLLNLLLRVQNASKQKLRGGGVIDDSRGTA